MKKFFKVFGITLASIVGVILIVLLVAIYLVFTPERLTPIVRSVATNVLTCQNNIDRVELTLFKTFPYVGLDVQGLQLYDSTDTLVSVKRVLVSANVPEAIDGNIIVQQLAVEDVNVNVHIDSTGKGNYDILPASTDTLPVVEDTTTGWTLKCISLSEALKINITRLRFIDEPDSIRANADNVVLTATLPCDTNLHLITDMGALAVNYKGVQYVDGVKLHLDAPVRLVDTNAVALDSVTVRVEGVKVSPLAREFAPSDIHLNSGTVDVYATINGVYSPTTMPLVSARVKVQGISGKYDALPFPISNVGADLSAKVDINHPDRIVTNVNRLSVRTGETSISLSGKVTDLFKPDSSFVLDNPHVVLTAQLNVDLPIVNHYTFPDAVVNKGTLKGSVNVTTTLNDVLGQRFDKVLLNAKCHISDLDARNESIEARLKGIQLGLQLKPTYKKDNLCAHVDATLDGIKALCDDTISANLQQLRLVLQGNLVRSLVDAKAGITFVGTDAQVGESIVAQFSQLALKGAARIDLKDTTYKPSAKFALQGGEVSARLDTISAYLRNPSGEVSVGFTKKGLPKAEVSIAADTIDATMGSSILVRTGIMELKAQARYNPKGENVFFKYNPKLAFNLHNAHAELKDVLPIPVDVPQITFSYSNRDFVIDTSNILLGNSSFSLAGEVKNLSKWLKHKDTLRGELRFTSENTDGDELLALLNGLSQDSRGSLPANPETPIGADGPDDTVVVSAPVDTSSVQPFMVPTTVDLKLLTNIKKINIFGDHFENMGGNVYIQDGKLILEELGFMCDAAKLQLMAMYKSPRKDHLYIGADFHMVDIQVEKLVDMIPQVDTLLPMLRTFKGAVQFHLALETYLNSHYQMKKSTIRGACAVEGKNLVLLDSETFSTIAKLLLFKKKTENIVDSISAQITLYKDMVTVYPFCLTLDKYMVAAGGSHYLDMTFNYHVCALKPIYLGVNVGGTFDHLKIGLGKCQYAKDFRPHFHKDVDENAAAVRLMISNSLKKSMKL